MGIINENFMLNGNTAKKLYEDYAKNLPIIDYHCHLNPKMIAEDYRFKNITELFLGGDHYKWRAMRSNGIDEKYITGDADDYSKFEKWAETITLAIGNPLYHWMHLELKRYFDIDIPLSPKTAKEIWDKCNKLLESEKFSARNLILRSNVKVICTTDDPADSLEYHKKIKQEGFPVKVLPTFRPDKAVEITKPGFKEYIKLLNVGSFCELKKVLVEKIDYFHENGCLLSDHGMGSVPYAEGNAEEVFNKAMAGEKLSAFEEEVYKTEIIALCGREYAKRGWTMQIHMGALRNNNSNMFSKLGADTGFDSIGDYSVAEKLSKLLDLLEKDDMLPKTILYSLNSKDNYVLASMIGNFQKAPVASKLQLGSGWWFNDQRDGMEEQLKVLANLGILGRFVGMLTDSRSFVSYPRHEYFRRILCNLLGTWVDKGEYPEDYEQLGKIVRGISYENAVEYFNF